MRSIVNFFINPISSFFATILTFFNFLFISIPLYYSFLPIIAYVKEQPLSQVSNDIFIYIMLSMIVGTFFYLVFDMIFGFTVKDITKNTFRIEFMEDYKDHQELFDEVLKQFELKNVSFLLQQSEDINAYAVASFSKKYVIITSGMLRHINKSFDDVEERRSALKGLIGHELSHLINWDFLPNLILMSGHNVSMYIGGILTFILQTIIQIISYIPLIGPLIALGLVFINRTLNFVLDIVYTFILHPLFLLQERYLGRLVEYRSDYQSAQALHWNDVYLTLYSLLSLNGSTFHSNFSTHPNTISRILKIHNSSIRREKVSVSFFSKYFGLVILVSSFLGFIYLVFFPNKEVKIYFESMLNQAIYNMKYLASYFDIAKIYFFKTIYFVEDIYKNGLNVRHYDELTFLAYIIGGILFLYILKRVFANFVIKRAINKANKDEDTALDVLLYFAVRNNDISSFIKILKYGANINTRALGLTIYEFAEEKNSKIIKYLKN